MSNLDHVSVISDRLEKAGELKNVEVSVSCRLLNGAYNSQMLELIAKNNPGVCRYENGILTMNGLAYMLFSEGMAGMKSKA